MNESIGRDKQDSTRAPDGRNIEPARRGRSASAWKSLVFGVCVVLSVAALLFVWRHELLTRDLREHYSRSAARQGAEIELAYTNYKKVFGNVTRIPGSAGRASGGQLRSEAAAARLRAVWRLRERSGAAVKRAGAPPEPTGTAPPLSKDLSQFASAARLADVAVALARAADRAARAAARAEDHASAAAQAPASSSDRTAHAAAALRAEGEAQEALAAAMSGVANPTRDAAAGARPLPTAVGHPSVEQAKAASEAAGIAAEEAKLTYLQAANAAIDAYRGAKQAWAAEEHARTASPSWPLVLASTPGRQATKRSALESDVRIAVEDRDDIAALHDRLIATVLPSYREAINACLIKHRENPRDAELCAAREIATSTDDAETPRSFEVAACPRGSTRPAEAMLSADGKQLVYVPPVDTRALSACGYVHLAQLVADAHGSNAELGIGSGRPFDEVLLLRPDGRVLYAPGGSSNLRMTSLPRVDATSTRASSVVSDVEIGSRKFRAFLQPVAIRIAGPCEGECSAAVQKNGVDDERVVLCGLVNEDRLFWEGLEGEPRSFLIWMALLCFFALSAPLAQLWLAGPKHRFRRIDVAFLGLAALLTTLLSIVLVLATMTYFGLMHRLDSQLAHVADLVTASVEQSAKVAIDRLDRYTDETRNLQEALPRGTPDSDAIEAFQSACSPRPEAAPSPSSPVATWLSPLGVTPLCAKSDVLVYPSGSATGERSAVCEQVTCAFTAPSGRARETAYGLIMDRLGNQWVRSVSSRHAPNPINVADRSYFQRALHRDTSCFDPATPFDRTAADHGCRRYAAMEVVRSNAVNETVLVAARPIERTATGTGGTEVVGVVALAQSLPALDEPLLPLGFQVAIVDRGGRVMIHSDSETRQGQALFDDFDAANDLAAAMAAHEPYTMSTRYRGAMTRIQVSWVPGLDWYLLVLAPRRIVDMVASDVVSLSLLGGIVLALGFPFLLLPVFAFRHLRSYRSGTKSTVLFLLVRPDNRHAYAYACAGVWMMAVALALAFFLIREYPPVPVLALSLLAATFGLVGVPPLGSLSKAWMHLKGSRLWTRLAQIGAAVSRRSPGFVRAARTSLSTSYALYCVGVAALIVVIPAIGVFQAARDHVLENAARAEQNHYLLGVSDKRCLKRLTQSQGAINGKDKGPDVDCSNVFGSGLEMALTAGLEKRKASCWLWPAPCVADWLPPLEATEHRSTGRLYRDPWWQRSARTVSVAGLAMDVPGLYSLHPTYFWIAAAGLLLLAGCAFALIRASTSRLFLLDVLERIQNARETQTESLIPDLVPAVRAPRGAAIRQLILNASPDLERQLTARLENRDGDRDLHSDWVIIVHDFEQHLRDLERLTAFESEIKDPAKSIVLFSQREPVRQAPTELAGRWAAALEHFRVVEAPPYSIDLVASEQRESSPARLAALWSRCTDEEQRVLAQLAVEGYANPHPRNQKAIAELAARGLLDPNTLTIRDEGLRSFVVDHVSNQEFAKWEAGDDSRVYHSLRGVFVVCGIVAFGVVLVIHPLAAVAPLIPVLIASLPELLRSFVPLFASRSSAS